MKQYARTTFAIFVGLILANLVIVGFKTLNINLYQQQQEASSLQDLSTLVKNAPLVLKLFLVFNYLLAGFVGSYTAARIARFPFKVKAAWYTTIILCLGAIYTFMHVKHEWWLVVACLSAYCIAAYLATKAAAQRG